MMKKIRKFSREERAGQIRTAIETLRFGVKAFPDRIENNKDIGRFIRQFRIKYGIYECF